MFCLDTQIKREALNYSILLNLFNYSESKFEPIFDEFAKTNNVDVLLNDETVINKYVDFFNVSKERLLNEFNFVYLAFTKLKENDEIIKKGTDSYPELLSETNEAPRFLYIRGKKSLLRDKRTVALVGSRNANQDSINNTKRLTDELGKNGLIIVSGLAKGIDTAAHVEALKKGFNTIAVIGTGLNQYYPKENKWIQEKIEKNGLVISQFSPACKVQRWFFPLRNGVMSGISLATIIMEAGETSGALKQADYALKQKRQVMILKKALDDSKITWPLKYSTKGAILVKDPSDVLKQLSNNDILINNSYDGSYCIDKAEVKNNTEILGIKDKLYPIIG